MIKERRINERSPEGKILSSTFLVDGQEVPKDKKYCASCDSIKEIEKFSSKGSSCRECASARAREYYHRVKKDAKWVMNRNEKAAKEGFEKKERAVNYKGGKCADCSGVFPLPVYDFHHLDPSEKEQNIGDIIRRKEFEEIKVELEKCVLLCANCHRIRHFNERKQTS